MNLDFKTTGVVEHDGRLCELQRAVIGPRDSRYFWYAWKACQDSTLKDSLSMRKEGAVWVAYRTIPLNPSPTDQPLPMPYFLKNTTGLLPYQPRAVADLTRAIIQHTCAVDGSDTGLGKTYVALAVCRELDLRPAIICKKSGISAWIRACAHFRLKPWYIVNWESARSGKFPAFPRRPHKYEKRYVFSPKVPPKTLLIWDEVHTGCNPETINSDLWSSTRGHVSLFLSATIADRPSRLENLFYMLGISERDAFHAWLRDRGHFRNVRGQLEALTAVADMKELHKTLYPRHGSRLSYEDPDIAAFFPDARIMVELVNLDSRAIKIENELYRSLVVKAAEYHAKGQQAEKLVAELRFRQSSELLKAPVLADMACDLIQEGRSVCIFVNYRDTLISLSKMLKTRSVIYGEQDRDGISRQKVIDDFQSNVERLVICMAEAGGQSLDLHDLEGGHQRVSLICPTYAPITIRQILGRTRRAGSKTTPIMKLVYAANTIEEKVADTVNQKLDNLSALNRGDLMEPDLFNLNMEEK
jgi:superfamily II DNA or RNA helicase